MAAAGQQQEKPAGQFAPHEPAALGFERHSEPVRCAMWEVYAAVLPFLLGLCARNAALCCVPGLHHRLGSLGRLLLDHCFITTGFCFCVITSPAQSYAVPLTAALAVALLANAAAFAALLARRRRAAAAERGPNGDAGPWLPRELGEPAFSATTGRARFVTEFRGLIYLPTCACILARDLPCFRLSFGKTRTFGTGLMDVGLGCFIFLMGLTAPTSRAAAAGSAPTGRSHRLAAMRRQGLLCLVLAACGLVRLAVAPDQAVEEYGRDWNVFFSLAAVKLAGSATELLVLPAIARGRLPPGLLACGLLAAYEAALGPGGLALAIVRPNEGPSAAAATRRGFDFFSANREGLASCVGLYCLYLLALQFGRLALPALAAGRAPRDVGRFIGWCAVLQVALLGVHALPYGGLALPESRRLASAAYVAWMLGFCAAYLAACAAVSCLFHLLAGPHDADKPLQEPPPASQLLQLVDRHGLAYFLAGNLLTGLIGRCLLPLVYGRPDFGRAMAPAACAPVLLAYMAALSLVAGLLLPAARPLVLSGYYYYYRRSASQPHRFDQQQQQQQLHQHHHFHRRPPPQHQQREQIETISCV